MPVLRNTISKAGKNGFSPVKFSTDTGAARIGSALGAGAAALGDAIRTKAHMDNMRIERQYQRDQQLVSDIKKFGEVSVDLWKAIDRVSDNEAEVQATNAIMKYKEFMASKKGEIENAPVDTHSTSEDGSTYDKTGPAVTCNGFIEKFRETNEYCKLNSRAKRRFDEKAQPLDTSYREDAISIQIAKRKEWESSVEQRAIDSLNQEADSAAAEFGDFIPSTRAAASRKVVKAMKEMGCTLNNSDPEAPVFATEEDLSVYETLMANEMKSSVINRNSVMIDSYIHETDIEQAGIKRDKIIQSINTLEGALLIDSGNATSLREKLQKADIQHQSAFGTYQNSVISSLEELAWAKEKEFKPSRENGWNYDILKDEEWLRVADNLSPRNAAKVEETVKSQCDTNAAANFLVYYSNAISKGTNADKDTAQKDILSLADSRPEVYQMVVKSLAPTGGKTQSTKPLSTAEVRTLFMRYDVPYSQQRANLAWLLTNNRCSVDTYKTIASELDGDIYRHINFNKINGWITKAGFTDINSVIEMGKDGFPILDDKGKLQYKNNVVKDFYRGMTGTKSASVEWYEKVIDAAINVTVLQQKSGLTDQQAEDLFVQSISSNLKRLDQVLTIDNVLGEVNLWHQSIVQQNANFDGGLFDFVRGEDTSQLLLPGTFSYPAHQMEELPSSFSPTPTPSPAKPADTPKPPQKKVNPRLSHNK